MEKFILRQEPSHEPRNNTIKNLAWFISMMLNY